MAMFLWIIYVLYWVIMAGLIWHYEKKIASLEEENRHVKELLDIVSEGRNRGKERRKRSLT
jgi:hypothetical protein